jgi:hypothetical protein
MTRRREQWATIAAFPDYQVSDRGRIRRASDGFIYRLTTAPQGYRTLTLTIKRCPQTLRIARIVGAAFCPDYHRSLFPVYLDGQKANCAASNLKWVPRSAVTGSPYSVNSRPLISKSQS